MLLILSPTSVTRKHMELINILTLDTWSEWFNIVWLHVMGQGLQNSIRKHKTFWIQTSQKKVKQKICWERECTKVGLTVLTSKKNSSLISSFSIKQEQALTQHSLLSQSNYVWSEIWSEIWSGEKMKGFPSLTFYRSQPHLNTTEMFIFHGRTFLLVKLYINQE